ncbi:mitochondrial ribosome assembly protein RRG9 KNAG_0F00980 [Huiozyma naganishii CBS 8797]|uniref:Required for respiratory growth protein 9, mitochondrial n=1 Tax=Huiozyma naganishii (strain ATCC MYA-139 / BCRC 22969 / CBS 8797 / KCTC 17520 / NBRC 10181 / NCYC 3082 / Yp74L-3) TaxID=1071383 RepID=J7RZU2_HUIN7|nr:hypothetical protein KNAG_0F00980 [Kazachstania naganishii CBS 8797]CCK70767.1 hypothetical protein KNAG_0F00980 [Kazachstania naganishii CBS 8797]
MKFLWRVPVRQFHCSTWLRDNVPSIKQALKFVDKCANDRSRRDGALEKLEELASDIPDWQRQKLALQKKFNGAQWNPSKKLSRTELNSVRLLKSQFPDMTASELGAQFKVSPEAIRRILKSKWTPIGDEVSDLDARWKKRGEKIKKLYGSPDWKKLDSQRGKEQDLGIRQRPVVMLKFNRDASITDYVKKGKTRAKGHKQQHHSKRGETTSESKQDKTSNSKLNLLSRLIRKRHR